MFVLDVLRWADSYDSILNIINDHHTVGWRDVWGSPFRPTDVDEALTELIRRGYIVERPDIANTYEMTKSGRVAWDNWIPPGDAGARVVVSRLLKQWDPIGVFIIDPDWPENEYEGYVSPIVDALHAGADELKIKALLEEYRTNRMCLQPSPNADGDVARQICDGWAKLNAT